MSRVRKLLLGSVVAAVVLHALVSYFIAASLTDAERNEVEESPADVGLAFTDVEFASRDGDISLSGWWIANRAGAPTIVFVHGVHATRESDLALPLAAHLVEAGFSVLLFDLRGHGRSGGDQVSGGYFERADVMGAIDFATLAGLVESVGLLGNSMGAATAILTAAEDERVRAIVADSPFASVLDMLPPETQRATGIPEAVVPIFLPSVRLQAQLLFSIDIDAIAPAAAGARLDYPVLVIHGLADDRVPPEQGRLVHAGLRHPDSELWLVPDVGHVEAFELRPEAYAARVIDYFRAALVAGSESESATGTDALR